MPASLQLQTYDGQPVELPIQAGEITAEEGTFAEGEPRLYQLANDGTTVFRDLSLWLDGPGADRLMLALDQDGEPGVWAAPGESIIPEPSALRPNEHTRFWLRPVFSPEDVEDTYGFWLRINGKSIGQNTGAALP